MCDVGRVYTTLICIGCWAGIVQSLIASVVAFNASSLSTYASLSSIIASLQTNIAPLSSYCVSLRRYLIDFLLICNISLH